MQENRRSEGTLYQFVRDELAAHGGVRTRAELLHAICADSVASEKLERSQGFPRLLLNLKYSGFVEIDGETVRATRRRVGRRRG